MLEFLKSKAPVDMLELFCKNPNKEFFSKEVGEKLDLSKATTIKWLRSLSENGILSETSQGRKKFYKFNWGNPLAKQIRVLITLSELIPALRSLSGLRAAYLVGGSARGTVAPDSPLELLILNRGGSRRIRKALDEVSSEIGREIEAKIMTPLEYAELARDNPNLHDRLEREKIRLTIS